MNIAKILVPVDFSECSSKALAQAAYVSNTLGAALHLLHVWHPPRYLDPSTTLSVAGRRQTLEDFVHTQAGHDMERFLAQLDGLEGVEVLARIEAGDPCEVIVELANSGDYDLVVMGTHGRRGLTHLLLGSIAERVVRRAQCPVMTVSLRPRRFGAKGR